MVLTGKQKAAMLLMSLDAATASELLKGIDPKLVQELAVELAYLDATGYRDRKQSLELATQFYNALQSEPEPELHIKNFLREMLKSTVGEEKANQIQTQIQDLLQKRDPFMPIRSVDSRTLAPLLENEHPQAVAMVLSELPTKKSSEVLGLLSEGIRFSAISRMTGSETVRPEAKTRIAAMICKRLETLPVHHASRAVGTNPEQSLRKVAVILRNLGKELRDGLLGAIQEKDNEAGRKVAKLMILWEDIHQVADRSLQEALRGIGPHKLALALVNANQIITEKVRTNISERTAAAVDEAISLISAPKKNDIKQAREEIIRVLREMNEKGELVFVEE